MTQFDLETWLKDKSRKVVTRDGRPVRIVCTDSPILHHPIVGFVECYLFTWTDDGKVIYGGKCEDKNDLFFADKEEDLTEFEKELVDLVSGWCDSHIETPEEYVNKRSRTLIDLAKKEIENSIEDGAIEFAKSYMEDVNPSFEKVQESEELWKWKMSCLRGINKAYKQGKEDALKDLPRWRKSDRNWITNICDLVTIVKCDGGDHEDFDSVVVSNRVDKDDYYIELGELLKLQKEE